MGLRFCGMVLLEPRPCAKGSATSPTSVCIISFTSVASFPSVPVTKPRKHPASAKQSRAVCQAMAGCPSFNLRINAACTSSPRLPSEASVPTAPPNSPTIKRGRSSARRARCRSNAASNTAILNPKVSGTACCRLLRPARGVSRYLSASAHSESQMEFRSVSTMSSDSPICRTAAVSVMSCVVAPQCAHSPSPFAHKPTSCSTTGSTGYPTASVRFFSLATSYCRTSPCLAISLAASAGMMPSSAWTRASATSMSRYFWMRFSSDQIARMASVLKISRKIRESIAVEPIASPSEALICWPDCTREAVELEIKKLPKARKPSGAWKSQPNQPWKSQLDGERAAATASALHVRVVELETGTFQRLDVIDGDTLQVHFAHLIDEHFQP